MNAVSMTSTEFLQRRYLLLPALLPQRERSILESQYRILYQHSESILHSLSEQGLSLTKFYRDHPQELVVVPERNDKRAVCRFECIAGYLDAFREVFVEPIRKRLHDVFGERFVLFKDKCNVKVPGGGAFPAHQDIVAYKSFGPAYYVTVAIAIDPSNKKNGCLEFAENYSSVSTAHRKIMLTYFGEFPIFDYHKGGQQNGDIVEDVQQKFQWRPLEMSAGDALFFDSYIPHRSSSNCSHQSRRMIFMTFSPERDGDHYASYYQQKRRDYANPLFHISTPTLHRTISPL